MARKHDDQSAEALDSLLDLIERERESGDLRLAEQLELVYDALSGSPAPRARVRRQIQRSRLDSLSDEQRVAHFLGQILPRGR